MHQSIIIDLSCREYTTWGTQLLCKCLCRQETGREFLLFTGYRLAHRWDRKIFSRSRKPKKENDLKLTPGFDVEYFSGSITDGDWASGLIAGWVIGVPGPSRCHLPEQGLHRLGEARVVLVIWNVWICCRDNGKSDILASCSGIATLIWSWGMSDILRGWWKGEYLVPGQWSIRNVIIFNSQWFNLRISGVFSLVFFCTCPWFYSSRRDCVAYVFKDLKDWGCHLHLSSITTKTSS